MILSIFNSSGSQVMSFMLITNPWVFYELSIILPGGDALEVEHDGRVGGEGRLLLQEHPQDGRGGREDNLGRIRFNWTKLGIL